MKRYLFFGLNSILNSNYNVIIKNLKILKEYSLDNNLELYILSGFNKNKTNSIIKNLNLNSIFLKENIICTSEDYYNSLSEMDKNIRLNKDKDCEDYYFKTYYFNNIFKKNKKEVLFIGNDVFLDGYYLNKYSNVDFILLNNNITFNNKVVDINRIQDIKIINNILEVIDFLKNNNFNFSYEKLNAFVNNYLFKNIIGNTNDILSNPKVSEFIVKNIKKNKKSKEESKDKEN